MSYSENMLPVDSKYKSRIFEMIFHEKKELLALYNAINGTDYKDPELFYCIIQI